MSDTGRRSTAASVSLGLVLAATVVTLVGSLAIKQPCASGDWSDGRQYTRLCYSDIIPLYGTEHLQGGRLPYLDACPKVPGRQCDEYPVLTMYFMRLSASAGRGFTGFYFANVALLSICALLCVWGLWKMVGDRAFYFALAPTLLIYAFVNWDLLAVALASLGTMAFFARRDRLSGALLALGAAAKLYPGLLVGLFALERLRQGDRRAAFRLAGMAAIAYAVVNLPFVILAPGPWSNFFRFNSTRSVEWDSLWFVLCARLRDGGRCGWSAGIVNLLSAALFVGLVGLLWWARKLKAPDFPRWTFAFPLLTVFLLAGKVYSPQYGLWLVPWFALTLPNFWLFAAFEAADVAVFVTRFGWFGRLAGFGGPPIGTFQVALLARALVLVICLVWWARRPEEALTIDTESSPRERTTLSSMGR